MVSEITYYVDKIANRNYKCYFIKKCRDKFIFILLSNAFLTIPLIVVVSIFIKE